MGNAGYFVGWSAPPFNAGQGAQRPAVVAALVDHRPYCHFPRRRASEGRASVGKVEVP